ncbi:hypothetical protein, partial [Listeria seeligeri]
SAERVFEMMDEEEEKDEIPANIFSQLASTISRSSFVSIF